ncbi:MAG: ATP-binding protein [Candidatus Omnitrophota bacterium]|nr:ATP-binding protein [Candidatus Omnitrophota bacterium]
MLNLMTFNRWWDSGKVDGFYLKPYKRNLFRILTDYLKDRQVLAIYGLRRTGKTTLIYQIVEELLKNNIPPKNILYFSFDENVSNLEELFRNYSEFVLFSDLTKPKRLYIFLDEIQKLSNWQNQIKIFYDLYPNIKFIISGSASILVQKGAKESLAGRIFEFILPLASFREFLELKNEKIRSITGDFFQITPLKEIYLAKERISPHLLDYAKKGGFIELLNEDDDRKIKDYARTIMERIIFADLPGMYKIRHSELLKMIMDIVNSNPGFLLDYATLSDTFKRDQRVVADYIFYLKYAMLIKSFYNFSKNRFTSERKLKKVYSGSTNFIFAGHSEKFQNPEFLGKVIENLVAINLKEEFFWRLRNNEVDFILKDNTPLEVKYKNQITLKEISPLLSFCKKFKIRKGIILTKDLLKQEQISGVEIIFIPVWIFLLNSTCRS